MKSINTTDYKEWVKYLTTVYPNVVMIIDKNKIIKEFTQFLDYHGDNLHGGCSHCEKFNICALHCNFINENNIQKRLNIEFIHFTIIIYEDPVNVTFRLRGMKDEMVLHDLELIKICDELFKAVMRELEQ
jgi:hypothetical protein